jgi:hypothetical protein
MHLARVFATGGENRGLQATPLVHNGVIYLSADGVRVPTRRGCPGRWIRQLRRERQSQRPAGCARLAAGQGGGATNSRSSAGSPSTSRHSSMASWIRDSSLVCNGRGGPCRACTSAAGFPSRCTTKSSSLSAARRLLRAEAGSRRLASGRPRGISVRGNEIPKLRELSARGPLTPHRPAGRPAADEGVRPTVCHEGTVSKMAECLLTDRSGQSGSSGRLESRLQPKRAAPQEPLGGSL